MAWRTGLGVAEVAVDFIREDENVVLAREFDQSALLGFVHAVAGGVVRAIDHDTSHLYVAGSVSACARMVIGQACTLC